MNKPKKESERFLWQLVNDTEKTNMWRDPWLGLEELVAKHSNQFKNSMTSLSRTNDTLH